MDPLMLAFIFAVGALGLFAYAFWTHEPQALPRKEALPVDAGEPANVRLGLQLDTLGSEIEKLSSEHRFLQDQLELAKRIESDLGEELTSFRQLSIQRQDSPQLQQNLADKEEELKRALSSIKDEIKEKIDKFQSSQPARDTNQELTDKISSIEAHIKEYKLELEKQSQILGEIRNKEAAPQGVPAEEYERIKKQLEVQESSLKKYKEEKEAMDRQYEQLKAELKAKEGALNNLSQAQGISQEEYNRLKEKLEQAEEVLKLIHAEQ